MNAGKNTVKVCFIFKQPLTEGDAVYENYKYLYRINLKLINSATVKLRNCLIRVKP